MRPIPANLLNAFSVLAFLCVSRTALASAVLWTNSVGGNWSTPTNWDTGVVPGPSDTALITAAGSYTVTLDVDATVASLTLGGASGVQTLSANSRTVTLNGPSAIKANGVMSFSSSTAAGAGALVNQGTLNSDNNTFNCTLINQGLLVFRGFGNNLGAGFDNQAGATLRIQGDGSVSGAQLVSALGFTNSGLIELTSVGNPQSATLNVTSGTLVNAAGGRINVLTGSGNPGRVLGAELDNRGVLTVGDSLIINKSPAAHLNSGSILLTNGNLTLNQSGSPSTFTTTGNINIGGGLAFTVNGGTLNYNSGNLGGPGTLNLTSATANFIPSLSNAITTLGLSGATLNGPGSVVNAPGKTLPADSCTINTTLINQGLLVFRGFGNNLGAGFDNQAGATLRIQGDGSVSGAQLVSALGFTNSGLIELTSVGNPQSATLNVTSGTLVNAAGGQINVLTGSGNPGRVLGAELDNRGVLTVGDSLIINKSPAAHLNSGSILLTNGNLTLNQSGSPSTFTTTGNINIGGGLAFTVNGGTLNYNSGNLGGPGTLNLTSATANFIPSLSNAITTLGLSGATLNGPGSVVNAPGKTLPADSCTINTTLINQGLLVFRGFGNNLGAGFDNQAGATLRIQGDGSVSGAQLVSALGFTNSGLIELTSVGNPQSATLNVTSGTLVNAAGGQINVLTGSGNPGRVLGAELDNRGVLTVGDSLIINKSPAAHLNSGSILLTNGNLTLNQSGSPSTFTTTGNINIGGGLAFTVNGGTLNYNSGNLGGPGTLNLTSATANFIPSLSNAITTLGLSGATLNGPGSVVNAPGKTLPADSCTINTTLINQGLLVFRGFGNNLGAGFDNQAGATLRIQGDGSVSGAQLVSALGFTNSGLIELTSVGNPQSATLNVTSGTLVNAAGGRINVLTGSGNPGRVLGAELDNRGVLTVGDSLIINKSPAAHLNSGSILLTNGNLTLNQSGSPSTFTTTGNINIGGGLAFTVNGGTLNYNSGNLGGPGTLNLTSATANFIPSLSNAITTLGLSGATLNGPGNVINAPGKTLPADSCTINTTLINQGLLVFRGFGNNLGAGFDNQAGATLRIQGDGSVSGAQLVSALGFTNSGLIELTSVGNPQSATLNVTSGTLVNAAGGQINVLTGSGNPGRVLGAELDNRGVLTVGDSLIINKSPAAHLNSGSILLTNGNLTLNQSGSPSTFTTTGNINIGGGLAFTVNGGTLNYNSGNLGGPGTLNLTSATANFIPSLSNAITTLGLSGATLNGPGSVVNAPGKTLPADSCTINTTLINQGLLVFRGFGNNLGAGFDNQAGATLRIQGDGSVSGAQLVSALGFTNSGLIELTSVGNPQSATLNVTSGTLVNAAGGQINVLTGSGNPGRVLGAELDNRGVLTVGDSLIINKSPAAHVDTGIINVSSGQTLQINGGTFQISPQGVLQGDGTFDGANTSFTNSGSVNPGASLGRLSIVGSYPQTQSGSINVEIGGRNAGVDYDQLQISGGAILGGSLNIGLTNGFRPSAGDTFEVVRYASHALELDHINGLDLGGGLFFQPVFSATNLVLLTVDTRPRVVFETPKLLSNGGIEITLDGTAGRDFTIEATTNFAPAIWTPIVTTTNAGAIFRLDLIDVTNFPVRFFRFKQ